jgi:peptide/nickel transport system substrate-binding protein
MADPAMRAAIALALDKDEISALVLGGNVQVATSGIAPGAWFFSEQPQSGFDPNEARQLLEEAGWTDIDGDGVREKAGLRAKIEICGFENGARGAIAGLMTGWLADVGIEAVPALVSPTDLFDGPDRERPCATRWGNFDLAIETFTASIDALDCYPRYHSSQFGPPGRNEAHVSDPGIDTALDRVRGTVDFVDIKRAMADFQRLYADQTVEVPLYYRKEFVVHAPRIGNFRPGPEPIGPTWNVVDWFVND